MQRTNKYQQTDKAHATHNQISPKIKPMHHTIKHQQDDETHATHNQISTTR